MVRIKIGAPLVPKGDGRTVKPPPKRADPFYLDAKGDIKQIDYVVYKWDAKGNYTEINPKGS